MKEADDAHRTHASTASFSVSDDRSGTERPRTDARQFTDHDESYVRYMASWLEEEEPVNWGDLWVFAPANREAELAPIPVSEAA